MYWVHLILGFIFGAIVGRSLRLRCYYVAVFFAIPAAINILVAYYTL